MKQLPYRHQSVPPMVVVWYRLVHEWIGRRLNSGTRLPALTPRRRRLLVAGGVVLSLLCQAVMLWILAELVDLCIALMEVWSELARKHLEIVLDETGS